jgi:hypothetical protein
LTIVILPPVVLAVVVLPVWARLKLALGLLRTLLFWQIYQSGFAIYHVMGCAVGLIPLATIGTASIRTPVLAAILPAVLATILTTILTIVLTIVLGVVLASRLLLGGHFPHRLGQKAGIVFSVLQEILGCNAIIRQLRITGKSLIFFNNLLRRSTHFAFGPRAVEDAVDNVA